MVTVQVYYCLPADSYLCTLRTSHDRAVNLLHPLAGGFREVPPVRKERHPMCDKPAYGPPHHYAWRPSAAGRTSPCALPTKPNRATSALAARMRLTQPCLLPMHNP